MNVHPTVACLLLCPLLACAGPKVAYKTVAVPDGDLPDRSIRFTLQGTTIALGASGTVSKAPAPAAAHGASADAGGAGQGTSPTCGSKADWTTCVGGMSAVTAAVAAEDAQGVKPTTEWTYIATPDSSWWGRFTDTYSLSSTPVGDDERLPKTITVTWTDHLKTIIATTSTGAATGFMFGPIGGAVGAAVGFAASAAADQKSLHSDFTDQTERSSTILNNNISNYVCSRDQELSNEGRSRNINYKNNLFSKLSPEIQFPVLLKPGPTKDFYNLDAQVGSKNDCWHPVPNNITSVIGANIQAGARDPQQGDGWFYRIAAKPPSQTATSLKSRTVGLAGLIERKEWFDQAKEPVDRFPVSNCEPVTLQVTWWHEIVQHSNDKYLRVWHQDIEIANPEIIKSVKIPKSGTINFRLSCGAYATNSFSATPVSDRITQLDEVVQTLIKAQTSK